jgi:hypothetical protein
MEIPADMKKVMAPNETVEMFVDGEKYPQITIDTVAITSERIILKRPTTTGLKTDLTIYRFSDITGVGVEKGFMRSIVRLRVKSTGETMDSIRMPPKLADEALKYLKDKVCGIKSPF